MLVLNEQEEIKDKIARRVPVIARKSSQEEPPKRKRTGFLVAFATRFFLYVHALPYMLQCALGNGSCFLRPKVIVMYGYSHTLQVTDIAGHIISRREVNELHPCVPAVCQYKIVFHADNLVCCKINNLTADGPISDKKHRYQPGVIKGLLQMRDVSHTR